MTFGSWPETLHRRKSQIDKMLRAADAKMTPLELDREAGTAVFSGRHGIYHTSLESCECYDFCEKKVPCKHIYRLAYELLDFDLRKPVKSDARKIVRPEEEVQGEIASKIASVIEKQPQEAYGPIKEVLSAIRDTTRLPFALSLAIEIVEQSLNEKSVQPWETASPSESPKNRRARRTAGSCEKALQYLKDAGLEYVDMTGRGGSLYFFDQSAAEQMKKEGYKVSYAANGTKNTNKRPAWFISPK